MKNTQKAKATVKFGFELIDNGNKIANNVEVNSNGVNRLHLITALTRVAKDIENKLKAIENYEEYGKLHNPFEVKIKVTKNKVKVKIDGKDNDFSNDRDLAGVYAVILKGLSEVIDNIMDELTDEIDGSSKTDTDTEVDAWVKEKLISILKKENIKDMEEFKFFMTDIAVIKVMEGELSETQEQFFKLSVSGDLHAEQIQTIVKEYFKKAWNNPRAFLI